MAVASHPATWQELPTLSPSVRLSASEAAAAFLPASLFQLIIDWDDVGNFFAVYDTWMFFPITNGTQRDQEMNSSITIVAGSPVLAATVGSELNSSGMAEPVRILLRLNEELEGSESVWHFMLCMWWLSIFVLNEATGRSVSPLTVLGFFHAECPKWTTSMCLLDIYSAKYAKWYNYTVGQGMHHLVCTALSKLGCSFARFKLDHRVLHLFPW